MALVIIIGIAVVLFLLAFVTRRRFGVLGLGLAAGVVLAQLWAATIAVILQSQGVSVDPLSYSTVGLVGATLLPALLLLISGPQYHNKKSAFVGASLFAGFAMLLLVTPIVHDFAVAGDTNPVLAFVTEWREVLIGLGVLLAVADILMAQGFRLPKRRRYSKH